MRNVDAYNNGIITLSQYQAILRSGQKPNDLYGSQVLYTPGIPETHHVVGTTESIEEEVTTIDTQGSTFQNIVIMNTGLVNSLYVRLSYMVTGDISYKNITDIVAPGDSATCQTQDAVYKIGAYVTDYDSGNHTTFEFGCSLIY